MSDQIEFYDGDNGVAAVHSSMVPPVGSLINIRGKTWKVQSVTFALDYADNAFADRRMRANVDLSPLVAVKP